MWNDSAAAVGILTRFRPGSAPRTGAMRLAWFPVVGALLGLALAALAGVAMWLGGPRAGVVLAAVGVFALEGWLTGGKRWGALIGVLEDRLPLGTAATGAYMRLGLFQGALLLRLLAYAVLAAHGRSLWLLVAQAAAAAAVAESLDGSSAGAWPVRGAHWPVGAVLALLFGLATGLLMAALAIVIIAWMLPPVVARLLGFSGGKMPAGEALFVGEAVLLLGLLLGALVSL